MTVEETSVAKAALPCCVLAVIVPSLLGVGHVKLRAASGGQIVVKTRPTFSPADEVITDADAHPAVVACMSVPIPWMS
jgi:hypothetical protein